MGAPALMCNLRSCQPKYSNDGGSLGHGGREGRERMRGESAQTFKEDSHLREGSASLCKPCMSLCDSLSNRISSWRVGDVCVGVCARGCHTQQDAPGNWMTEGTHAMEGAAMMP